MSDEKNAVRRAVAQLGGVRETAAQLTAAGCDVGKSTVSDWCTRGLVFRASHALALAELTGVAVEALASSTNVER